MLKHSSSHSSNNSKDKAGLWVEGSKGRDSISQSSITTPSLCSTCSIDDFPSDSEEGDGAVTWPWMQYVDQGGELLYIDSYFDDIAQGNSTLKDNSRNLAKEGGIQRKLRNAIRKSNTNFNSKHDHNHSKGSISSKSSINSNGKQQIQKDSTLTQKVEKISDNVNLISHNVILDLGDKVERDFVNLENVLGIISGLDLDTIKDENNEKVLDQFSYKRSMNSIVVQGVIPHSPAGRCQNIFVDDVIVSVNNTEVDMRNIDSVLNQVNGGHEAVLRIERVIDENSANLKSDLCYIVSNENWDKGEMNFQAYEEMCAVMYLTLDSNEEDPESDILFWYPESKKVEKLKRVRGIFLTIQDVMVNVTGTGVQSSILMIDGKQINVCYEKLDSNVLAVAVPNERCSMYTLRKKMTDFLSVLEVINKSVESSFSPDMLPSTRRLVEKFTDLLLQDESNFNLGFRKIQLSTQQYVEISAVLSDAEAADYGECANDFFPHRRLYGTVGSCLFYKDVLVCNHLPDRFLKVVLNICTYFWFFMLVKKETLRQLIVWKELFLESVIEKNKEADEYPTDPNERWFLLIVGQGRSMFCTLLQAGGPASLPTGNPGPHPFYVDASWSILKYLIETMDIETTCRNRMEGISSPPIITPTQLLNPKTSQSPRGLELTRRKVAANADPFIWGGNSFREGSIVDYPPVPAPFEKMGSRNSSFSSGSGHAYINGFNNSQFETTSYKSLNTENSLNTTLSTKLTTGPANSLFCFAIVQPYSGVFICPNSLMTSDTITNDIMTSFRSSCEEIHEMFKVEDGLSRDVEHGILFNVESTKGAEMKKGSPNLRYWVVGRRVTFGIREEEIYVCFEDGVPQNMIEMAFKMRFGCYY